MNGVLDAFVPPHFRDPLGLAVRLLRTGRPEAIHALAAALAGPALSPIDRALARRERALLADAPAPTLPILFVMGPPRSGTTLVALSLIRCLPVSYLNNLTALFPRSPITANRLLPGRIDQGRVTLESFYGRTRRLSGPNDALYLWDRWLGTDRTRVPQAIVPSAGIDLVRFFGAWEQSFGGPLVAKNNSLNGSAHLVAALLPSARFLCLRRDPLWLAASLFEARRMIHGDLGSSYGIDAEECSGSHDPVDDVVRQLLFHSALAARVRQTLGPHLRELSYEEFCADPVGHVIAISSAELGLRVDPDAVRRLLPRLDVSRKRTLPPADFARLERAVGEAFPAGT